MREADIRDKTRNEDWIKARTWDVFLGPLPVTKLDELFKAMGHYRESMEDQQKFLRNFVQLPVWQPAPRKLKSEVEEFLASSRDQRVRKIKAGQDSPRDPDLKLEYRHGWIPVGPIVGTIWTSRERRTSGMRLATDEDRKRLKVPPAWTDVRVTDDPRFSGLLARGRDAKGRIQSLYSAEYMQGNAEKKFERVKELTDVVELLDKRIVDDLEESEEAAALLLIRKLGMRPGSMRERRAAEKAYGATTLLAKHVKQNPDTGRTTFSFTGKKGVKISVSTTDPEIFDLLDDRLEDLGPDDRIFYTNEDKVRDYLSEALPGDFKVKDLRTLRANVIALAEVAKVKSPPKTKTEYRKRRKVVAEVVAKALGNTATIALASYINPTVFHDWQKEPDW